MMTNFKPISCSLFILILFSCQSKVNKLEFNASQGEDQKAWAQDLSVKILSAQKEGGFYKLNSNEASLSMVNAFSESVQKKAYQQIKMLFGDYEKLKFHSVVKISTSNTYDIFRFKGLFESGQDVEVRVVLNTDGKLEGFFVKPWKETL